MASDEELMAAAAATTDGGASALASLFERHRNNVYGFCFRLLGERSAAEDAVQDVFLRIYDRRHNYRVGAKFTPWMYTIAKNLCADRLKSASRREVPMSQIEADCDDWKDERVEDEAARSELAGAVRDAVNALPEDMRMVVILREYQELDYREIATVMSCSEEAVRVRMHRARQELRKRLGAFL